jgi:hypothetical protein
VHKVCCDTRLQCRTHSVWCQTSRANTCTCWLLFFHQEKKKNHTGSAMQHNPMHCVCCGTIPLEALYKQDTACCTNTLDSAVFTAVLNPLWCCLPFPNLPG